LRGQPLNVPLLDVWKTDELEIKLSVSQEAVATTQFIDISTQVVNRLGEPGELYAELRVGRSSLTSTERSIRIRVTLEPLTSTDTRSRHPSAATKNLMIDGSRTKMTRDLQPGDKETHTVSVMFMAKGQYTFRAIAQELMETPGNEGLTKFSSVLSVQVEQ
jgi:hypothetical protein